MKCFHFFSQNFFSMDGKKSAILLSSSLLKPEKKNEKGFPNHTSNRCLLWKIKIRKMNTGLQSHHPASTGNILYRSFWIFLFVHWCLIVKSCPTLCDSMEFSVHEVFQARILEWVASSSSREIFWLKDWTPCISCLGRQILYPWATCKALVFMHELNIFNSDFFKWSHPCTCVHIYLSMCTGAHTLLLWNFGISKSIYHIAKSTSKNFLSLPNVMMFRKTALQEGKTWFVMLGDPLGVNTPIVANMAGFKLFKTRQMSCEFPEYLTVGFCPLAHHLYCVSSSSRAK